MPRYSQPQVNPMTGDKMTPDEQEQAFRDAKAKAWLGDRDAQFSLGKMYCEGRGIPQDDPRSPEQPTHYMDVTTVPNSWKIELYVYAAGEENFWEAWIWFDIADRNGHPEAAKHRDKCETAIFYHERKTAAKDEAWRRHIDILRPAAWQGDADAQCKLGEVCMGEESRVWLFVAMLDGHKQAQKSVEIQDQFYSGLPPHMRRVLTQEKEGEMEMAKARRDQIKEEDITLPHPQEAMKRRYARMEQESSGDNDPA